MTAKSIRVVFTLIHARIGHDEKQNLVNNGRSGLIQRGMFLRVPMLIDNRHYVRVIV